MPRLAVVGGRGWLGTAIVDAARQRGLDVIALARTPTPGARAVDLTNTRALAAALTGCTAVVNAAGALPGRGDTDADLVGANVELPERLAVLAAAHGHRLVHVGSAAEYGPSPGPTDALVDEEREPAPVSPYGRTKLAGTEAVLAQRAAGAHALVALAVRPEVPPTGVVNVCSGAGTSFGELAVALGRRVGLAITVRDRGWPRGGRVVGDPRRLPPLVPLAPIPS